MKAYVSSVLGKYIYVFLIVLLGLTVCLDMPLQGDCGSHVNAFVTTQPLPWWQSARPTLQFMYNMQYIDTIY